MPIAIAIHNRTFKIVTNKKIFTVNAPHKVVIHAENALFNIITGHDHNGVNSKKIAASNVNGLSNYFDPITGHDHNGTDSKKIIYANVVNAPVFEAVLSNIKPVGSVASVGSLDTLARADHIHFGFPLVNNAGAHNSVYRGISLGTSVSSAQFAAIAAGTFNDMYIGDYWTIGGINWRIAGFNYYLNCGDQGAAEYNLTTPHLVIVPDTSLYDSAMNSTNTTEGGYYNSVMKQSNLAPAISTINSAFGSDHVMKHRNLFVNAVANGRPSNGSWYDMTVDLMNEVNVFGAHHFSPVGDGTNIPYNYAVDKSIFPLFIARPDLQCNRQTFWLRDVVSSAYFAIAFYRGFCDYGCASTSSGVRPAFCLKS